MLFFNDIQSSDLMLEKSVLGVLSARRNCRENRWEDPPFLYFLAGSYFANLQQSARVTSSRSSSDSNVGGKASAKSGGMLFDFLCSLSP